MREAAKNDITGKQIADGIKAGQFVLHFQPILSIPQKEVVGFEALVRWHHPDRGLVSPANFIPVAESTGVIVQLGAHVITSAFEQMANWQREQTKLPEDFRLNINLSPRQLFEPDFANSLREAAERFDIETGSICLEITESILFEDSEHAITLLRTIREDGFHLSLDDFGTGYSSLNYLDELPVDSLKIDRSFVGKLETQGGDHAIIRMIIALAKTLDVAVVAEGVEKEQQLKILESMSCDFVQGYYFARPMTAEMATGYLQEPSRLIAL